jgi:hypothetical protein
MDHAVLNMQGYFQNCVPSKEEKGAIPKKKERKVLGHDYYQMM